MEIRHLEDAEDVRGVLRVNLRAWEAAYGGFLPDAVFDARPDEPDDETVRERFEALGEHRDRFLVAVEDGSVVGYAYFRWEDTKPFVGPDEAGLKEIYVDPDHWGEGAGTALLERGLELLPDGVEALKLEMLAENDVARGFYEARGFEAVDRGETGVAGEPYETAILSRGL